MDRDPDVVGATVPIERGVVADVGTALSALVTRAPSTRPARDWTAARQAYRVQRDPGLPLGGGIDPSQVIAAMREVLPEDAVMTNDAGNFSAFLHRHWRYDHPRTQLAAANGAMGYGCRPRSRRSWPLRSAPSSRAAATAVSS